MKPTLVCDTEVYKNYFLISFRNVETGNVRHFEMYPEQIYDEDGLHAQPIPAAKLDVATLYKIFRTYRVVTFNGINFDMPLISAAMRGATNEKLKAICDKIISGKKHWELDIEIIECDHVDIFNVAPGVASLKIYGGRLHCERMQDLPITPDSEIYPEDRPRLREYCANDLATTEALFLKLGPQIELREKMGPMYDIDLRSKSDAQIAEAVIRKEVERLIGRKLEKPTPTPGDTFLYAPPAWVKFETQSLRDALAIVSKAKFSVAYNGALLMPDEVKGLKIVIGKGVYRMGIGGLHSSEKCVSHVSDADTLIVDRDVTSYYPSIILNCGLRPRQMGPAFTMVYRSLVERRLAAKRAGNTVEADALKITINGSFGKFGSPYSALYSPTLLIQTTITGQLALLMMIESLELAGIPVISANTDGIVIKCPRDKYTLMDVIFMQWEEVTGFATEETRYTAIHSRDVNNYIALKDGGGFKLKGAYAPAGLQKNPTNEIAIGAVVKFLVDGTPISKSIRECRDIKKFVTIRQVKGGAVKDDEYLGRAVRWYYAKGEEGTINYKVNGYKVARTEGARPLMQLPETFPEDVDYEWYCAEALGMLGDIGYL